jgi:PAS domain S-box-containing protein
MKEIINVRGNKAVPGDSGIKTEEFFIVGIGASAGGVQALQQFFKNVTAGSNMAYVVILHLSPNYDSQLAKILQQETQVPVVKVTAKILIRPDTIYVVPPDHHLSMEDAYLAVLPNMRIEDRRAPVDIFFRSLANEYGPRAISVILSGTGANGSMGLKRVKELGGATYVQHPEEAQFDEMPKNAIATELIDEVLNVVDIPARIASYRDGIQRNQLQETLKGNGDELQQEAMQAIFTQLKSRTGHDFSNYKHATVLRRIERRISVHNLPDLPTYVVKLCESAEEVHALLKDLLISVTNFFRDRKAFDFLETTVIPALFAGKGAEDEVRIWVAGCATGEEAYSIAMLCSERVQRTFNSPKVQIFATDIDEPAILFAREGLYTINDAADVSSERLTQFLTREGDLHRVKKEIRDMVLFANHNFIKDPPFSKLDLISCRNVLIYLNNIAQSRVMESFHFALRSKGLLFLGTSESVDANTGMYSLYNSEHHIYAAKEITVRHFPVPDSTPRFKYLQVQPLQQRPQVTARDNRLSFGDLHQKMLEEYAPPSVVINSNYDIVHISEKAGRYFEFSGGEPTQNLLKLLSPQIRLELRAALFQVMQFKGPIEIQRIKTMVVGKQELLDIQIRPALKEGDAAEGLILIIFKPAHVAIEEQDMMVVESNEPVAKHLEEELIGLKAQLRDAIEYHEYQAEELKASNEELQAMNEELRSAAEELETSKEELQSINEELRTVNQELKVNVEETMVSSNNLQNLINSASVGTIFVDRTFAIRLFTPAVLEIFNLKSGDYGRPLSDITHNLKYEGLLEAAKRVLVTLAVMEQEVVTADDRTYMMRLLPYRTAEDRIGGVVFTFFDITSRKASEQALRESEEQIRMLIEGVKDYAIFMVDLQRQVVVWNSGAQLLFGYTDEDITGISSDITFTEEDRQEHLPEKEIEHCRMHGSSENEHWHLRKDGSRFWGSGTTQPIINHSGIITGFVKIMRDLTKQKELQEALRTSEQRYLNQLEKSVDERAFELNQSRKQYFTLVENTPDLISRWDRKYRLLFANKAFGDTTGIAVKTNMGKTIAQLEEMMPLVIPNTKQLKESFNSGKVIEYFNTISSKSGARYFHSRLTTEKDDKGKINSVLVVARDITAIKTAEIELNANRDLLQSILDNSSIAMSVLKAITDKSGQLIDFEITLVNRELEKETGRTDLLGKIYTEEYPGVITSGLFELMKRVYTRSQSAGQEYYYPYDGFNKWYSAMFIKMGDGLLATNLDITDRKLAEQKMKELEAQGQLEVFKAILNTQEEERRRTSESLHNGLGQLLYSIKLGMANIKSQSNRDQPEEYQQAMRYTENLLTEAIRETRNISHKLMPADLEQYGLDSAISQVCKQLNGEVKFTWKSVGVKKRLESYLELATFRTVQELMLNVVKHSGATRADVKVTVNKHLIEIKVADNGRGMAEVEENKAGIGLTSIQSRMNLLQGEMKIISKPDDGTEIIVKIPINLFKGNGT